MKRLLLILLIFSFAISQYGSGKYGKKGIGVIVGQVINEETGSPIEYASVTLVNNSETNTKDLGAEASMGQLSDESGSFLFKEIKSGSYTIEVNFMGFEKWSSDIIHISKSNYRKDIGVIKLKIKSIEVGAIEITESKEIYEFEVDKLVYNPDNDIVSTTGSAEDVLNNAPMVTVDQDGEVQLRGKSNVNILIDGRKNRIDLANIAGSQIERVEVITSPSAKYDPEGMAGIINIILKKGSSDGFTGSIKTNGGHNQYRSIDEVNGFNMFGNYRKGPLNLFSSLGLNNKGGNRSGYRNTITTYMDTLPSLLMGHLIYGPDIIDSLFYSYENQTERSNINFRFGFDYFFNNDLTLTSEFKISNYTKIDSSIQTFTIPEFNPEIAIEEEGLDTPNLDLEYLFILEKEFKVPDQELKFSFAQDKRENHSVNSLINSGTEKTEFTDIDKGMEIDFSYKTPFLSNQKIEFGYDGRIINNTNMMSFDTEIIMGDGFYIDTIATNTFQLNRNIHSFFIEYENQITDKLSIKPSFRYEYVDKEISFETTFDTTLNAYWNVLDDIIRDAYRSSPYILNRGAFYPNLHIQYNLTPNQSLTFGLGKRVDRPGGGGHGSWQIMPFPRNVYNDRFVFIGNPYLKPEYSTQYEINYSRPIPMGFANFNIFYNEITNLIEWYDDDSYFETDILTFKNVANAYTSGIGLFAMIMGQTFGGGYTITNQRDDTNPDDYELNENSEHINFFSKIQLPEEYIKLFDFEFGVYWMKIKLPSGSMFGDEGTAWANLGFSKKLMNNKLTLSFTIDNLFDSGGFQMTRTKPVPAYFYNTGTADGDIQDSYFSYEEASEFSDVLSTRNGRTFKLTLKYQLGKVVNDNKKRFDSDRGGDGGMMDMGY